MSPRGHISCAICDEPQTATGRWFVIAENRWTDRLRVSRFEETRARQPGVYCVCCSDHVRELVVHWMATGRLDYPFAQVPKASSPLGRAEAFLHRRREESRQIPRRSETPEQALSTDALLGELAVHRESLTRVLRENPQALSAVLETLIREIELTYVERPAAAVALSTDPRGDRVLA